MANERADKLLVDLGIVSTRSQAKLLINEGVVFADGKKVLKPSMTISGEIEIRKDHLFVSRGAHKLEKALDVFNIDPRGKVFADIGASTGGFTDLLLLREAKKVYAIDVGHDQLAQKLKDDERVFNFEGVNIRYGLELPEKVDHCVADLSYISLKLVLLKIFELIKEEGSGVFLVKPQFEVGKENLGKNGIVKNLELRVNCLLSLYDWCKENKLYVSHVTKSPIEGKTGNTEYLFLITKKESDLISRDEISSVEENQ